MSYMSVKGKPGLVRDKVSGAILNINSNEISAARKRKIALQTEKAKVENLQETVDSLKNDINEIKALLKKVLEE